MTTVENQWDQLGSGTLAPELFRTIVDNTAYAFVVIDVEGGIRYAGASTQHTIGWPSDSLVGRNLLDLLHPDDVPLAREAIADVPVVEAEGTGVAMVFRVRSRDGDFRHCEVGASVTRDVDGSVLLPVRFRPWSAQQRLDTFIEQVGTGAPVGEVVASLADAVVPALEATWVVIHRGFDGERFGDASASRGVPVRNWDESVGPWIHTAADGRSRVTPIDALPGFVAERAAQAGIAAVWTIRVTHRDAPPAVVSVWRESATQPLGGHRQVIERVSRYLQLAQSRASTERTLRFLATHDSLTGLVNRSELRAHLRSWIAESQPGLAIAFCDLDRFKPINDTHGHAVGDAVLEAVAGRLAGSVKANDVVAREGGDEFVVLLGGVDGDERAARVGQRFVDEFRAPFVALGIELSVSISVGVACHEPGLSSDELIRRADAAVYRAKADGGNQCRVWSSDQ